MVSIENLSVRISVGGKPVGSGFVIAQDNDSHCYIVTARHCLPKLEEIDFIDVEWYDYNAQTFITLRVNSIEHSFLTFPVENSYDGAVLVISKDKLPVSVPSVVLYPSIQTDGPATFDWTLS